MVGVKFVKRFILFILIPISNFLFWFRKGTIDSELCLKIHIRTLAPVKQKENFKMLLRKIYPVLSSDIAKYKEKIIAGLMYPDWSLILMNQAISESKLIRPTCNELVHPHPSSRRKFSCFSIVYSSNHVYATNLFRYDQVLIPSSNKKQAVASGNQFQNISGFFSRVGNKKGRKKLRDKMSSLIHNLVSLESEVLQLLSDNNLFPGDPIVLMVLNTGEVDLFANFVCSCLHQFQKYNSKSSPSIDPNIIFDKSRKARKFCIDNDLPTLSNILVFAGSPDIVPILESMGVMALYHEATFAHVSKTASNFYLDSIFIDMMWYKSFSVWMMLRLGFDVLFQDIDIVWFRNPLSKFAKELREKHSWTSKTLSVLFHPKDSHSRASPYLPDIYLSDDGQRSLRYAPFYANSGFYYVHSNARTIQLSWSIMAAFDLLQVTGSHQNIYTFKLMESLDLSDLRPGYLNMDEFPSGVKFSHDAPYMLALKAGTIRPYMFHMCWTSGKVQKLVNFKASQMWYLNQTTEEILGDLAKRPERLSMLSHLWKSQRESHDTKYFHLYPDFDLFFDSVCSDPTQKVA